MALTEKDYLLDVLGKLISTLRGPVPFHVLQAFVYSDPLCPLDSLNQLRTVSHLLHQLEDNQRIFRTPHGISLGLGPTKETP